MHIADSKHETKRNASQRRVTWNDLMTVLERDQFIRSMVLQWYREGWRGSLSSRSTSDGRGWGPDDFARLVGARRCMADGLTAAEDYLDGSRETRRRVFLAVDIRVLRRRIEIEVWP